MVVAIVAPLAANATSTSTQQTSQQLLTTLEQQIASLKAQIQALNTQLESLKKAQGEVKETTQEVKGTLKLLNQLKPGMSGEEVKKLQEILATDSDVYPEGLISGYYGKLTEKAVRRLQNKFCLDQVGNVGPKTLWKINELLTEGAGSSGKVPPGLLKAPGIQKKLCVTPTSATTTAPVISNIEETNITDTGIKIIWTTNKPANSKIWYGTAPNIETTVNPTQSSSALVTNHEIILTGLTANTIYYYVIASSDSLGGSSAPEGSFTTLATPDTTAPVISNIQETDIASTTAKISWTTNESSNSKIWYGTTTPIVTTGDPTQISTSMVTNHEMVLTGLTASSTYYYVIGSSDSSGNTGKTTEDSFITLAQ